MQFKKTTLSWLIFIIPVLSFAQSTNLQQGAKENWLLNRMDIKLMGDSLLEFTATKPYLRKTIVAGIEKYYSSASLKNTAGEVPLTNDSAGAAINNMAAF